VLDVKVPRNASAVEPGSSATIEAGPEWAPFKYSLDVEPGSAVDFSFLADGPAGKYGPLMATPEGHFAFRDQPGQDVRFWGVNLTFNANYLDKADADRLAERFARSGYNTVRLHHYDKRLAAKEGASSELDAAALDRLEYLFAAMKKRGIYINIDLYTVRRLGAEEMAAMGIPAGADGPLWFKALTPISEAAYASFSRFATNLLSHRNPYTGLTWAEDPALIGICPVNEAVLFKLAHKNPEIAKRYDAVFAQWKSDPANAPRQDETPDALFNRFLLETTLRFDARNAALLRSLGSKALVTGSNWQASEVMTLVRKEYDYVDFHGYWDHPSYPGGQLGYPITYAQRNDVDEAAAMPRFMMAPRLFGKPCVCTEFNFVTPNASRSSGAVIVPAYASLQGWDALYTFDYASNSAAAISGEKEGEFSLATDPMKMLGDRISALLFRRGDIASAKGGVCFAVDRRHAMENPCSSVADFPWGFSFAGLITRIGSLGGGPEILSSPEAKRAGVTAVVGDASSGNRFRYRAGPDLLPQLAKDGVIPSSSFDTASNRFVSETGQIELNAAAGTLRVVTDRSECFVLPSGGALQGKTASVRNGKVFSTLLVVSVDGNPLAQSQRLLVADLTNSSNSGMRFEDGTRTKLVDWGGLPHLLRRGTAEVSLRLDNPSAWKVWEISPSGARIRPAECRVESGRLIFNAGLDDADGGSMAYELSTGS